VLSLHLHELWELYTMVKIQLRSTEGNTNSWTDSE